MLLDHQPEILKDILAPLILGSSCQGGYGGSQTVTDFLFLGSRITADVDCSHEIKRRLLLGKKAVTNLDSILKNRDISLPTKICLIKGMVFPVVMYECESWTIKKSEHWRIDAFELFLEKTLESSLDSKEIKPVNPKISPQYSWEGLMLKQKI